MRGGTSRGLVFNRDALPEDSVLRDAIFLCALGSPDVRQLAGVGAGDSHSSKIAVVSQSQDDDADVDYLFGEVAITEARVDYAGNSGNLISALGLYAVEENWVVPMAPATEVRVRNLNTEKITLVSVRVQNGAPADDGDYAIDGVPGRGARIDLVFPRPEGALTGRLLPAGEPASVMDVPGVGRVRASLIDAANPLVIVEGTRFGVSPQDSVASLNANADFLRRIRALRAHAAVRMGLIARDEDIDNFSNMVPFPVLLFPPSSYQKFGAADHRIDATDMDLCARVVSLNTVSVGLTAAALVSRTLAEEISGGVAASGRLRLGHPSGTTETFGKMQENSPESAPAIAWVRLGRTARRIMQGEILVQPGKLRQLLTQLAPTAAGAGQDRQVDSSATDNRSA